ncbi:zinc finger and BTB domain-containing protein 41-like [Ostrinia nubilalis]|uniref:zinc finger and BTB domain-containing protein 41-like n=1 Tax=Ostrinia nubilalis TaxID=29057 RepID=UPI0030824A20
MLETNFKLCWETYKNNLSDGFFKLQQRQEFVDVTLAAGGHLVKAHQNIIALASPYLKEMLRSAPCQHPVIFLGSISHSVLCCILEYIYSGEVNVPSHLLPAFVEAAKLLHISGIKDLQLPEANSDQRPTKQNKSSQLHSKNSQPIQDTETNKNSEHSSENCVNIVNMDLRHHSDLEVNPIECNEENVHLENFKYDDHSTSRLSEVHSENFVPSISEGTINNFESSAPDEDPNKYEQNISDVNSDNFAQITSYKYETSQHELENNEKCDMDLDFEDLIKIDPVSRVPGTATVTTHGDQTKNNIEKKSTAIDYQIETAPIIIDCSDNTKKPKKTCENLGVTPLYTKSNRGSLQMVMNRFVYYLHHSSRLQQKRRWRCINYRKMRCPAFIDTNGEIILCRKNPHNHKFQDEEIFKMGRRKEFYTSIAEATDSNVRISEQTNDSDQDETTGQNTENQNMFQIKIVYPN